MIRHRWFLSFDQLLCRTFQAGRFVRATVIAAAATVNLSKSTLIRQISPCVLVTHSTVVIRRQFLCLRNRGTERTHQIETEHSIRWTESWVISTAAATAPGRGNCSGDEVADGDSIWFDLIRQSVFGPTQSNFRPLWGASSSSIDEIATRGTKLSRAGTRPEKKMASSHDSASEIQTEGNWFLSLPVW